MKKLVILSIIFVASVVASCVKPFEYTIPLALDNIERTWPKNGANMEDPVDYIRVTSSGIWEAKIIPAEPGETWCWIEGHYIDKQGNEVPVAEVIEYYEGTDKGCKARGKGTVWLPVHYMATVANRYATFIVRRVDGVDSEVVMRITQK